VTKTHQIVEQVPVKTMVNVTENVDVTRSVPVTRTKQVVENVSVTSTVPVTEHVQVTKSYPVTKHVEVTQHVPINMTQNLITDNFAQLGLNEQHLHQQGTNLHLQSGQLHSQGLNTHQTLIEGQHHLGGIQTAGISTTLPLQGSNHLHNQGQFVQGTQFVEGSHLHNQGQFVQGTQFVEGSHLHNQGQFVEGSHLNQASHLHQGGLQTTQPILSSGNYISTTTSSLPVTNYRGIPGCKVCQGIGFRKSKKHAHMKACKPCVKATGQCGVCNNTGIRLDDHKNCTCYYAK